MDTRLKGSLVAPKDAVVHSRHRHQNTDGPYHLNHEIDGQVHTEGGQDLMVVEQGAKAMEQ